MDAPTRELLKKDVAALDVPNDARLTLDGSRKASKAGETADWKPGDAFYKVGPLTAKEAPPAVFIGGDPPQKGPGGGGVIVKPVAGARTPMIDPDNKQENDDPARIYIY